MLACPYLLNTAFAGDDIIQGICNHGAHSIRPVARTLFVPWTQAAWPTGLFCRNRTLWQPRSWLPSQPLLCGLPSLHVLSTLSMFFPHWICSVLGQGSATLSMAYAGALFADACLRGLNGETHVIEPAFVASSVTELPFFASKVRLGPSGAQLPILFQPCQFAPAWLSVDSSAMASWCASRAQIGCLSEASLYHNVASALLAQNPQFLLCCCRRSCGVAMCVNCIHSCVAAAIVFPCPHPRFQCACVLFRCRGGS